MNGSNGRQKFRGGVKTLTGSGSDTLTVDCPRAFMIQELTFKSTGSFTVKIRISDDDEYMVGTALEASTIFGTGAQPRIMPVPRSIKAGSTITCELTDLSGSSNRVDLTFLGLEF